MYFEANGALLHKAAVDLVSDIAPLVSGNPEASAKVSVIAKVVGETAAAWELVFVALATHNGLLQDALRAITDGASSHDPHDGALCEPASNPLQRQGEYLRQLQAEIVRLHETEPDSPTLAEVRRRLGNAARVEHQLVRQARARWTEHVASMQPSPHVDPVTIEREGDQ